MGIGHFLNIGIKVRLQQHIYAKKQKGASFSGILLSFVPFFIRRILRFTIYRRSNLIYGKGLYHLPLLVSYPRSGTNWMRFLIESLSGRSTPGRVRLHSGRDYAVDRAHFAPKNGNKYSSLILVLRDYRECLIRHNVALWKEYKDVNLFLKETLAPGRPGWYIENIQFFDRFKGEKLLLYYEDMLDKPDASIRKLASILGVHQGKAEEVITDFDKMKKASIASYHSSHGSSTAGDVSKLSHHAESHLTLEQMKQFDKFYKERFPELFNKYLFRYNLSTSNSIS